MRDYDCNIEPSLEVVDDLSGKISKSMTKTQPLPRFRSSAKVSVTYLKCGDSAKDRVPLLTTILADAINLDLAKWPTRSAKQPPKYSSSCRFSV